MIKLQVIGHLGKDCIVNQVSGKNVMNFTVAHSEKFKDQNGATVDKTIWVECAYWSDRTAVAPYLKKGTLVYVEGSPEVKTYSRNNGQFGASLTLRVGSVQLLGSKPDSAGNGQQSAPESTSNTQSISEPIDDLPF